MVSEKIGKKAGFEIALTGLVQLVPLVGGTAASWWSGYKQERINQRIESLTKETAEELQRLKDEGVSLSEEAAVSIAGIIESTFDRVEAELNEEKIKFFKNFIRSTLHSPDPRDLDLKKILLDALTTLSMLDCHVLVFLYKQNKFIQIANITGYDLYTILGSINRLKSHGFIETRRGEYMQNGTHDEALSEYVNLSAYGREFTDFCIL